jgi:DNA repair photolyase
MEPRENQTFAPTRPGRCAVNDSAPALIPASELLGPTVPHPPGIARTAALAPEIDLRNEVSYSLLPSKSLLARCTSERVPFEWSINPYRGCEHACPYCFARYTHEYMELEGGADFDRKVFVKQGAAEILAEELRRNRRPGEWLAIGTATDPYQPAERRYRVTRSLLTVLARYQELRLSITTKSDLVLRDLDLLQQIDRQSELCVNLTITTLDRNLARLLEPRAVRPDLRLRAVSELSAAGLRVAVFVMPVLPYLTDAPADLEALAAAAASAGARHLVGGVLFLRSSTRRTFFRFLEERFPHLLPAYRRLYGDYRAPLEAYSRPIDAQIARLKEQYGLDGRLTIPPRPAAQPTLALF